MIKKRSLPFQNLNAESWLNLALAAVLSFYLLQISFCAIRGLMFVILGMDYFAFWSAGYLANTEGYAQVYDLNSLRAVQEPLLAPTLADLDLAFVLIPIPFLPVFILPFQLLAHIEIHRGFWVWTLLNLLALILYMRFFIRDLAQDPMPARPFVLLLLSFPVFGNLFVGQVNVWLTICLGEFM